MPTYVYECRRCAHRFEVFQSIMDAPRRRCPQCRGAVRRVVMPGGGLIFKGSGFYITDYKHKEGKDKDRWTSGGEAAAAGGDKESLPPKSAKESGGKDQGDSPGKDRKGPAEREARS